MKRIILLTFILMVNLMSTAQSVKADSRLKIKYSVEELQKIETESPSEIAFLNYCIENAFRIADFPSEKKNSEKLKNLETVEETVLTENNFFNLGVDLLEEQPQYFKIKGTDKLLIIDSEFTVRYKMAKK